MFEAHYAALVVGYAVAFGGWLMAIRLLPQLWPAGRDATFEHPWREFGIAILAGLGIIAVGQLWRAGVRLPEEGSLGPINAAVNQFFIFAPMVLLPVYRKHPWTTAWVPRPLIASRIGVGVALAGAAIVAYSVSRAGAGAPWEIAARIASYRHVDELVQVFFEDVTIAILFVRLARAVGARNAIGVVAALFAAGHIPAMLSQGRPVIEFVLLLRDVGLLVVALSLLRRSRDIVWIWPVHFVMDMTQFDEIAFG